MNESIEVTEENLQTISTDEKNNDSDINEPEARLILGKDEKAEVLNKPCHIRVWNCWCGLYATHSLLIGIIVAILVAKAYPPLGAIYLYPQITATWIAVMFIFVLAGLGLKTEELSKALTRLRFNFFVQVFNFGVVSAFVFGFTKLVLSLGWLSENLAEGMIICACLPLTVNMVCVLTVSAGGDEASAIFNAAFGNLVGVFLSPVLILGYLGITGDVDLAATFTKLAIRVILPIVVGQIVRKVSKSIVNFVKKHKKKFKKLQELSLTFIVYTVFCKTFMGDAVSSIGDVFLMILYQFICLSLLMIIAWFGLKLFFANEPTLRVMGLFGCTHKTVAMGVPLIGAMYENNPNVGLYTLPLIIWHPMQLVIGSFLVPKLRHFVEQEVESLRTSVKEEKISDVEAVEQSPR